ncbi:unnamed protein product [Rotaria sp. Silwood2]|nr:unnamed protein product [Rotaria sp. Silwood2]CAF3406710.1 unnamed protein product [Rotaria sp. Silwood2]CAF4046099.1 unnamed protein product [Rotaria sp. Silwood2]CAF4576559.1 unnamed protein product [Rotaria sp. Silwood2]CAF4628247.1 unnamed protein product [Rotaria sp. Silwood2]
MPSNEPSLISISMQNKNNCQNESLKQYQKEIGDYKRDILMETLKNYETIIEENKYLYQQELFQFEYGLSKHIYQINDLMNYLNDYLNHRTDRIIPEIRDKQAIFRMKLKYPRHCRKLSSSNINKSISIYPEAIVETSENFFTRQELSFLSSTGTT